MSKPHTFGGDRLRTRVEEVEFKHGKMEKAVIIEMGCGFAYQLTVEFFGEEIYSFMLTGGHVGNVAISKLSADCPIVVEVANGKDVGIKKWEEVHKKYVEKFLSWFEGHPEIQAVLTKKLVTE